MKSCICKSILGTEWLSSELPLPGVCLLAHTDVKDLGISFCLNFKQGFFPWKEERCLKPQIPIVREHGKRATNKTLLIPKGFFFFSCQKNLWQGQEIVTSQDPPQIRKTSHFKGLKERSRHLSAEQTMMDKNTEGYLEQNPNQTTTLSNPKK